MFGQMRGGRRSGGDDDDGEHSKLTWKENLLLISAPALVGGVLILFLQVIPHYFGWDVPEKVCRRWMNCVERTTSTGMPYDKCDCEEWIKNPRKP